MKLFIISILLLALVTPAQAQTDPKDEKTPTSKPRDGEIFGLLLGKDSLEDIAAKSSYATSSECRSSQSHQCKGTYELYSHAFPEYKGKYFKITNKGDADINFYKSGLTVAKFQIEGENFSGMFFDNKLVALSLLDKMFSLPYLHLDDAEISVLMSSFNKKYKNKTVSRSKDPMIDGEGAEYTYHSWRDPKNTFDVQITQRETVFDTVATCLASSNRILDHVKTLEWLKEVKNQCAKKRYQPVYYLEYKSIPLYAKAMEHLLQLKLENEKDKLIEQKAVAQEKTNRINKF